MTGSAAQVLVGLGGGTAGKLILVMPLRHAEQGDAGLSLLAGTGFRAIPDRGLAGEHQPQNLTKGGCSQ
jgi:hypothetical protein